MKALRRISWLLALVLLLSAAAACAQEESATLYIGVRDVGFKEYPLALEGDLTPEALIAGIQELTGWDLTLADAVTSGKGGMTVCFSADSALFVGPPDPQNPDFFVYDAEELAQTILDSVQKTLQMNFTNQYGDPDTLDIYYCMEDDQPLTLPDIGRTWPLDEPYQWQSEEP